MLLPESRFLCEGMDKDPLDEAGRDARILERHIANGYLLVRIEDGPMQVALFKDRTNDRDVIGTVYNCGMGCMCNSNALRGVE